jgi:hypothetical protein
MPAPAVSVHRLKTYISVTVAADSWLGKILEAGRNTEYRQRLTFESQVSATMVTFIVGLGINKGSFYVHSR